MSVNGKSIIKTSILIGLAAIIAYALYNNFLDIKNSGNVVASGDQAPDFQLTTLEGETVKLSDYKGQGVFLNFWASYCPPCKEEMPYMQSHYEVFKDKGVVILAINIGEPKHVVESFVSENGFTFPILLDPNQEVVNSYGVVAIPVSFLIDENGKVVDRITASLTESQIAEYMKLILPE